MIKYIFLVTLISTSSFAARTEVCPKISPVMIESEIDVKVSFDKKTENYIYKYKFKNLADAKVPLRMISIENTSSPLALKAPKIWDEPSFDKINKEIRFTVTLDDSIFPGKSADGFEIISKNPPGLVQIYMQGGVDIDEYPTIKYDTDEEARRGDDESITCPGWFRTGGLNGDQVATFTTGPSIPNRVEAKIRIKKNKDKKWRGNHKDEPDIEFSPLETGKIQLMLFGNKELDVSKINLSTLEFGRGKAKPVKTQIISEFKESEDTDDEIKKQNKENTGVQHLLIEFNLQDVDVKCDIDRALFLTGKIDKKDLFGAVKIKHAICNKKTFSKEAKKIKDAADHE